jgi:hypothetical protein
MKNQTTNIPATIFVISLVFFGLSQLVINSILAPLGTRLQALNSEKNFLVEENREMEEEIAKTNSITIIKKLSGEKLSISSKNDKSVVYIEDSSIIAERN